MFNNLVESGSHRRDLARKGRFMLGTLALYGVLLTASGVAGVFAYDARLERQNFELTYMVHPVPFEPAATPPRDDPPRPPDGDNGPRDDTLIERAVAIAPLRSNTTPPDTISTRPNPHRELPDTGRFIITGRDGPDAAGGPTGPRGDLPGQATHGRAATPVRVNTPDDPLPPTPAPTATPRPDRIRVTSSVISSKVIAKPAPPYPRIAVITKTTGSVNVEIVIDERGSVISARAVDGPAMLRVAAEQAARQARFTPTLLGGQPVKVSGVITYNFVLN